MAVEREFGVTVPSEEVGSEAFATVAALAAWLAPRLGAGHEEDGAPGR